MFATIIRCLLCLLAIGWSFPVFAQEKPAQDLDPSEDTESADLLETDEEDIEAELFFSPAETQSSATRHAQPLELSPSAITVLTKEDIESSGARSLPELLRLVPNMDIQVIKPFWHVVGVRGNSYSESNSMLLLVDGRDLRIELLGFPLWTNAPFSMDEVERVEVIRGPGSSLYGANAYSGLVHVITQSPESSPKAFASLRSGEHGMSELHGSASQKWGPFALGLSAGAIHEDFRTDPGGEGRRMIRGRVRAEWEPNEQSRITIETLANTVRGELSSGYLDLDFNEFNNFCGRVRLDVDELMTQLTFDYFQVDANLGSNLIYRGIELGEIPPLNGYFEKLAVLVQHSTTVFYNRLTYGAEYTYNFLDIGVFLPPQYDEHRAGLFIQDEFDISALVNELANTKLQPLILTWGLRYDINSITQNELSPKVALVYVPFENHSFRVGYAHAFRKPTFLESSFGVQLDSQFGFDHINGSNPELENQTIDSLEFGYQGAFLEEKIIFRIELAANWYRKTIWSTIDESTLKYTEIGGIVIPDLNSIHSLYHNDGEGTDGHDVEIELITKPMENLRLFSAIGYRQVFQAQTRIFSPWEAVWHVAAGIDFRTDFGLTSSLRAFYVSQRTVEIANSTGIFDPTTTQILPGNLFFNARVAWLLHESPFEVTTGLEGFNIFGTEFREYSGRNSANGPDFGGERLDRRVVLFVQGKI